MRGTREVLPHVVKASPWNRATLQQLLLRLEPQLPLLPALSLALQVLSAPLLPTSHLPLASMAPLQRLILQMASQLMPPAPLQPLSPSAPLLPTIFRSY